MLGLPMEERRQYFYFSISGCLSVAFRYRNLCCLQEGGWEPKSQEQAKDLENWGGSTFPIQDFCEDRKPRRRRSRISVQPQAIQGVTITWRPICALPLFRVVCFKAV